MVATALRAGLGALVALQPRAAYDITSLGMVEALVFVLGVFAVLTLHGRTEEPLSSALGIRPTHPALSVLGVALGVAAHFPAESVDALFQRMIPTPDEDLAARAALLSGTTPLRLAFVLLVVACVGPFVEEIFFRGALYGVLRRQRPLVGTILVTAVCFVVGHLDLRMWPALVVVALVLSYLRAVSGSLLPPLAMHVAFNATTELAVATGQAAVTGPPEVEVLPTVVGWLVTLALVLTVRYVASRAPLARRGRAEDAE